MCTDCDEITQGIPGYNGWSPTFETVVDAVNLDGDGNSRVVLRLTGWVGGEGPTPTIYAGEYLTTGGYTATLASATNIRGEKGADGADGAQGEPGSGTAGNDGTDTYGTDLTGSGVPSGGACVTLNATYTNRDNGAIYTCNGAGVWTQTSTSVVNTTSVLNLNISSLVPKLCASGYIVGNTIDDYLSGIIAYLCAISGGSPSAPIYNSFLTFGISDDDVFPFIAPVPNAATNFWEQQVSGSVGSSTVSDVMAGMTVNDFYDISADLTPGTHIGLYTEAAGENFQWWVVPVGVTSIQVELYGGATDYADAPSSSDPGTSAFILREDNNHYYYATPGSAGSAGTAGSAGSFGDGVNGGVGGVGGIGGLGGLGGFSNCPIIESNSGANGSNGSNGTVGQSVAAGGLGGAGGAGGAPAVGGAGTGVLVYNTGDSTVAGAAGAAGINDAVNGGKGGTGGAGSAGASGSGAYGKVTLSVTPGDKYYIFTRNPVDASGATLADASMVIISWVA